MNDSVELGNITEIDNKDDDDDDMADLFSFGNTTTTTTATTSMPNSMSGHIIATTDANGNNVIGKSTQTLHQGSSHNHASTFTLGSGDKQQQQSTATSDLEKSCEEEIIAAVPKDIQDLLRKIDKKEEKKKNMSNGVDDHDGLVDDDNDNDSHDSFMELLNVESDAVFDDVMSKLSVTSTTKTTKTTTEQSVNDGDDEEEEEEDYDKQQYDDETITMLKWLDASGGSNREIDNMTEEVIFNTLFNVTSDDDIDDNNTNATTTGSIDDTKPTFDSLADALQSTQATKEQIRTLVEQEFIKNKYTGLFGDRKAIVVQGSDNNDDDTSNDNLNNNVSTDTNEQQQQSSSQFLRPELYCRMICGGKSISDIVANSSLADSFEQWRYHRRQQLSIVGRSTMSNDDEEEEQDDEKEKETENDTNNNVASKRHKEDTVVTPNSTLRRQAKELAKVIAVALDRSDQDCETDLLDLLYFYYQSDKLYNVYSKQQQHPSESLASVSSSNHDTPTSKTTTMTLTNENSNPVTGTHGNTIQNNKDQESNADTVVDVLVPAVAAMILASNIPVSASAVVLSQIIPSCMPLLALQSTAERYDAAMLLHSEFYYLACYHIPLLVIHLDRHIPGWHWPKDILHWSDLSSSIHNSSSNKSRMVQNGQIPPSWLLSHLAGECTTTTTTTTTNGGDVVVSTLQPSILFHLWDHLLSCNDTNNTMTTVSGTGNRTSKSTNVVSRFFLTLSLLEQVADKLILLTGEELVTELKSIFTIPEKYFAKDLHWVEYTWWECSLALQRHTPQSVLERIRRCEDGAVQGAVRMRQMRIDEEVQARLDAEAAAHKHAQEVTAQAARDRLSRARLVAFYRQYAPDKESNIDIIMETYSGRLEFLDSKLKMKYGVGFNPALDPNKKNAIDHNDYKKKNALSMANMKANNFFTTMHQNFHVGGGSRRKQITPLSSNTSNNGNRIDPVRGTSADDGDGYYAIPKVQDQVSVTVSCDEVVPILCWSKEAVAARGSKLTVSGTTRYWDNLKFHIIDCRTEEAVNEQGRFPTATHLSPDLLMDPDLVRAYDDKLEALRGMCHIVVMGEGYSALPKLYNQKLTPNLEQLMLNDEAQTNGCALFFCKKGFPFVSVLEDGFAGALAFLYREGSKHQLYPSTVLLNYSQDKCIFGQFEKLYHSSATEKAQRKMHRLLETGLVSVTKTVDKLTFVVDDQQHNQQKQSHNKNQPRHDNTLNMESPTNNSGMQSLRLNLFNRSDPSETDATNTSGTSNSSNTSGGEQQQHQNANGPNPFKGLGFALNSTMKSAAAIAVGSGGESESSNSNSNNTTTQGGSNVTVSEDNNNSNNNNKPATAAVFGMGFAGFNNFRKSTMARIQVQRNPSGSLPSTTTGTSSSSPAGTSSASVTGSTTNTASSSNTSTPQIHKI